MGRYLTPLPGILAGAIEWVLNQSVQLDPDGPSLLRGMQPRWLKFEFSGLDVELWFSTGDGRFVVRSEAPGPVEPSATLVGTPASFLALALPDAPGGGAGSVSIHGEIACAQQFQRALRQLNPDWEVALTERFGPVLGGQIHRFLRSGQRAAGAALEVARDQTGHWLRNESELVPNPEQWQAFAQGVEALRDDVDRLAKRIRNREQS